MPSNYLTLTDVKNYWPENEVATTSVWDTMITTLCANLSRAWDTITFRNPGDYKVTADSTLLYDGVPDTATDFLQSLAIDEIAGPPTSVSIKGVAVPSNDYWLEPYNAVHRGKPFTSIYMDPDGTTKYWGSKRRSITVVGPFGYSTAVPADVLEAMLLYVVKLVRKGQQNYLDTGTIMDSGQILVGMKQDNDLNAIILHYRRIRFVYAT